MLESVYEICLLKEFELWNIDVKNQVPIILTYKGVELKKEFKIYIFVENEIIIELKSVDVKNHKIH